MPRTRASNSDAKFKVFYSKKVPVQSHLPHLRKTVRRRTSPERDGGRQMVFLKDKLKELSNQSKQDAEASDSQNQADDEVHDPTGKEGKKIKQEDDSAGESMSKNTKKRKRVVLDSDGEEDIDLWLPKSRRVSRNRASSIKQETLLEKEDRKQRSKRQSTMTQMVDGRRPLYDREEPNFQPIKRSPRTSWGRKGSKRKDIKQRTLTQMVPGMLGMPSPSDEEQDEEEGIACSEVGQDSEDERESQAYSNAITQRLAQQGVFKMEDGSVDGVPAKPQPKPKGLAPQSTEVELEARAQTPPKEITWRSNHRKSTFKSLSTPDRRRVTEIRSSQSPAESILSTQTSPLKSRFFASKMSSSKDMNEPSTPSKHSRALSRSPLKVAHAPPVLKFQNTVRDSEDEESEIDEDDLLSELGATVSKHQLDDHRGDVNAERSIERSDQPVRAPSEELASVLPDDIPSTPMVLEDDSADEAPAGHDESAVSTPKATDAPQDIYQQLVEDDLEHVEESQEPRIPGFETQESFSSRAEEQLQSEWLSYSQYHGSAHVASSVKATWDSSSLNATLAAPHLSSPILPHISQATTVDEVTPRKNRTQKPERVNVTPHRRASSQPFISPSKPPPLVIPSSYPSPSRAGMGGWDTQLTELVEHDFRSSQASPEDFSIPLPPPVEHD